MLSTQFTHSCTCSFVQNMTLFTHLTEYWICIPLHTFCTYTLTLADSGITVSFINYNTIHSTLLHLYKYIYCCSHITMPHHLLIQIYINNHIHTVCINVNIPWTWAVYVKGKIRLVTFLLGCVCPRWKHSFGHCKTSTLELFKPKFWFTAFLVCPVPHHLLSSMNDLKTHHEGLNTN